MKFEGMKIYKVYDKTVSSEVYGFFNDTGKTIRGCDGIYGPWCVEDKHWRCSHSGLGVQYTPKEFKKVCTILKEYKGE